MEKRMQKLEIPAEKAGKRCSKYKGIATGVLLSLLFCSCYFIAMSFNRSQVNKRPPKVHAIYNSSQDWFREIRHNVTTVSQSSKSQAKGATKRRILKKNAVQLPALQKEQLQLDLVKALKVRNGYASGSWQEMSICQPWRYVDGFQLYSSDDTYGDDSGVIGLWLHCSRPKHNHSKQTGKTIDLSDKIYSKLNGAEPFGGKGRQMLICQTGYYAVAFRLRADSYKAWRAEEAGMTNLDMRCRGPGLNGKKEHVLYGNGMNHWGDFGAWSAPCELGTAVCAMVPKSQTDRGMKDDVGMTDLQLLCCKTRVEMIEVTANSFVAEQDNEVTEMIRDKKPKESVTVASINSAARDNFTDTTTAPKGESITLQSLLSLEEKHNKNTTPNDNSRIAHEANYISINVAPRSSETKTQLETTTKERNENVRATPYSRLYVHNGNGKGSWLAPTLCPINYYATGFQMKSTDDTIGDDAGMTRLKLICSNVNNQVDVKHIYSSFHGQHFYGSKWRGTLMCEEEHYIVAFRIRADSFSMWKLEHAGMTNMDVICRGPGLNKNTALYVLKGNGMSHWGDMGAFSEQCPLGTAVCGMKPQVMSYKYHMDDFGMTDIIMFCC